MITLMKYNAEQFNSQGRLLNYEILVLAEGRKSGNQLIFWVDKPDFQGYLGVKITKTKSKMPSAITGYNAIDLPKCTQDDVFDKYPEYFL